MPDALRTYLEALIEGDHRTAYDRTGLRQLVETSASAATLSFEHFAAFHRGDPLRTYEVRDITKLDRRTIDAPQQGGTAYHVVDLTLVHASGRIEQTISVDGAVLGVVEIDPVPVAIRWLNATLSIDGIESFPATPGDLREGTVEGSFLVLAGAHTIAADTMSARIATTPLRVLSGDARIEDGTVVLA